MDPSQSTAIKDLPFKKKQQDEGEYRAMNPMAMASGEGPPPPVNTGPDAAARMVQIPMGSPQQQPPPHLVQKPVTIQNQMPKQIEKKEFFGLASFDYKTTLVVFALLLIFSSTIFYDFVRKYIPMVSGEGGRTTLLGSLFGALIGSIIFVVIKIVAKL